MPAEQIPADNLQHMEADNGQLLKAINTIMPFGRYQGQPLLLLPEPYLVWFKQQGFPEGLLGRQLGLIYEIKLNGMEHMLMPLLTHKGQADVQR